MREIGSVAELQELVEASRVPLYIRWCPESDIARGTHWDSSTDLPARGLRALQLETGMDTNRRNLLQSAMEYSCQARNPAMDVRCFILIGAEIGQYSHEALLVGVTKVAVLSPQCIEEGRERLADLRAIEVVRFDHQRLFARAARTGRARECPSLDEWEGLCEAERERWRERNETTNDRERASG